MPKTDIFLFFSKEKLRFQRKKNYFCNMYYEDRCHATSAILHQMYYINSDIDGITDEQLSAMLDALPQWRREQAMRYKFRNGRVTCAAAFLLLRDALLKEHLITPDEEINFSISEHGKPSILGRDDIFFNISHCRHAVACIVGTEPCGIDIEDRGRYHDSVAQYAMNAREQQDILQSADSDLTFTRLWTQKEAVLKCLGTGINDDMKDVLSASGNITVQTVSHPSAPYVCSIARQRED